MKIARILVIGAILIPLTHARPAVCEGWSPLKPFSSNDKTATKPKKHAPRTAKKPPSTWDKVAAGAKNFFNKTGEMLGLKKPASKKPSPRYAYPKPPTIYSWKKQESKSWFGSWFQPEKPKKPRTVSEWMENKRLDP